MTFTGKNVLIAGGSSGIGLATACAFAAKGANVWIIARDQEKLIHAEQQIIGKQKTNNQLVGTIDVDLRDLEQTRGKISRYLDNQGCPDVLIHSVGIGYVNYFQNLTDNAYIDSINTNFFSALHLSRVVLPDMVKQKSGHVVFLSSVAGFVGVNGYSAYSPSKFAIKGYAEALRAELRFYGIRVSIVYPPNTDTPGYAEENITKPEILKTYDSLGSLISPQVVADAIIVGILRKKYIIFPNFESRLFYLLKQMGSRVEHFLVDYLYDWSVRKTNRIKT
jgi:3-dehydrosphinganine reductase